MLTPIGDGIWRVEGPQIVAAAGFHYPTRMVVMQLRTGGLALWSPIDLSDDLQAQINAIGPVAHLIAPNALHHMALADWATAYPQARCHAAPGLRAKRPDLTFHHDLTADADPDWQEEIAQVIIPNRIATEVVFFHRPSGTALFTDLLQQMPKGWYSGWRALIARADLMVGTEPQVPRKFRLAMTDRTAARAALSTIQGWSPQQVVMAHGTPVTQDAQAVLRRAFAWLIRA